MWLPQALSFWIRNKHKSDRANPFARVSGCSRSCALAFTSLISGLNAIIDINNEPFLQLSGLVGGFLRVSFLHSAPQVPSGAPTTCETRRSRRTPYERITSSFAHYELSRAHPLIVSIVVDVPSSPLLRVSSAHLVRRELYNENTAAAEPENRTNSLVRYVN